MKLNQLKTIILIVLLAAALIVGVVAPISFADGGRPDPGTVVNWSTYTYYPATYISGAATTLSASPRQQSGVDVSKVSAWNSADIFLTADISGTTTITLTPQFSPNASDWASAYYDSISGTTVTAQPYRIVLSADGTSYVSLPIRGEYLRVSMLTGGDGVTATVRVTLRNN